MKKHFLFFGIALLVLLLDQLLKQVITFYSVSRDYFFVKIHFVKNFGVGFGLLDFPFLRWVMVAVISLVIIGVLFYYSRSPNKFLPVFSLALILGGALGNLADRIMYGFVVDFIDFGFWPAFNIADSGITIGIVLLIGQLWFFPKIPTKSSVKQKKRRPNVRKNRNI